MGDTSEKSGAWFVDGMEYVSCKGYDMANLALLHADKVLNGKSKK